MSVMLSCLFLAALRSSAGLLALLYVMFSLCFVTFPFGVLGQVWYLIVSIPDICLLPYFEHCTYCISKIQLLNVEPATKISLFMHT